MKSNRNINVLALAATLAIAAVGIGYEYVTFRVQTAAKEASLEERIKNAEMRLERMDDTNAAGLTEVKVELARLGEVIRLTASVNQQFALLQQAAFHSTTPTRTSASAYLQ